MPYYRKEMDRREEEQKAGIGEWIPALEFGAEMFGQPEIAMALGGAHWLYNQFHHSNKQRNFHGKR